MLLLRHGETTKPIERTASSGFAWSFPSCCSGLTRRLAAGSAGQILASKARKVAQKITPEATAKRGDFSELVRCPRLTLVDGFLLDSNTSLAEVGEGLPRLDRK